ncbi:CobW family GTP-binding protein [Bradyrhizobium oligotrophicum]|uniref:CobW family GTP-binding protein n=1 Tax=Bradyrhizobium oligotrophicum TaxID=44255 RepID=UPI003EB90AF6
MTEQPPALTPTTLLTGFLGSGKTTLLRRLLADPALHDTAIIINEFGDVALDHHLIERLDEQTILLGSGCVCCTVRGELAVAMRDLFSRRERALVPPFRRLVIESTGLADPFPVLSTLRADPVLRHHFRAGGVVTTVDAVNGLQHIARHPEALRQIAAADVIALTKTDIAGREQAEAVRARLQAINPLSPVIAVAEEPFAPDRLLSDRSHGFKAFADPTGPAAHSSARAFSIVVDQPLDWSVFGVWLTMLLNRHGTQILRVKGVLSLQGETRPVAVRGVQHLVHTPTHLKSWPDDDRRSRLVFIVDGIAPDLVKRSFAAFTGLSPDPSS